MYSGRFTQSVREQFTDIVKRALHQFIADRINERIKTALTSEEAVKGQEAKEQTEPTSDNQVERRQDKIVTTEEELEGFYIVKSILRDVIDPKRIVYRDTINYFGILLDDTNRKPICRLHFNRAQKYIGLFNDKIEERISVDALNDIYKYADRLKSTALSYEGMKVSGPLGVTPISAASGN